MSCLSKISQNSYNSVKIIMQKVPFLTVNKVSKKTICFMPRKYKSDLFCRFNNTQNETVFFCKECYEATSLNEGSGN